jgi:hypothetical protein
MIEKPSIIITSAARTGTTFFFKFFKEVMENCIAFHEPDRFGIKSVPEEMMGNNKFQDDIWKINKFGFLNLTLKKLFGKWGLISLSNKRISGEITVEDASKIFLKERKNFIDSFSEEIYVESSYHYYGLIDVTNQSFKNHKLVYVVRDGRDWVRSHINVGLFYHKYDFNTIFNKRLTPMLLNDNLYKTRWKSMSQFEKLCWVWVKINEYAYKTIEKNPNAKLYYFEDIFKSQKKYNNLNKLLEFVTSLEDVDIKYKDFKGKLEEKVYKNPSSGFPHWKNWSKKYKNSFDEICGPLMSKLGYGHESKWK